MVAHVTAVAPTSGKVGTNVTVTGSGFTGCRAQIAWRHATATYLTAATIVNDSTMTGFVSGSPSQVLWDVGVYDLAAAAYQYKTAAFFLGTIPATLTASSPAQGALTGGTTITVTGTALTQCQATVYVRGPDGYQAALPATSQTATTMAAVTTDMTGHGGRCDVGVYDAAAATWVWLTGVFYAGTPPPGDPIGRWDYSVWDGGYWQQRRFAPGAGWGYDWRIWYQYGGAVQWDMTDSTVEVRWSTDAHTAGDGTFRGDIQPGTFAIQLHDPAHKAESLSKLGTIWLHYGPANFTWGFYVDTVTRQLVAPGDPTAADVVVQGSVWPLRLSTDCLYQFPRPAERADTRLGAIATFLSQNNNLALPRYDASIAAQSHVCTPVVAVAGTTDTYPSALTQVRNAAANGVAWVSANLDGAGLGKFQLNYARWEAGTKRNLAASDIVAGIPYDSSMDDILTEADFAATAPNGTTSTAPTRSTNMWHYGSAKASMRVWADMVTGGSPDITPVALTAAYLLQNHSDPTIAQLSTVTATSGQRVRPDVSAGPPWNPAAHVWSPVDILHWVPPAGSSWGISDYWVTKTDHRLRAAAWDSAHTVEPYTAPAPLPA